MARYPPWSSRSAKAPCRQAAAGAYTGLDMEKTELEDLAYAVKVMAAEMIDNRQITAQYTGKNPMVMQILDLHSTNLLPSEG